MVYFGEIHVFLQLNRIDLFGTKRANLHLEKPKLQGVFLSNQTQFSQGNNVLDAPTSNIDGFLWRGTCVSITHLNRRIWRQQSLPPPSNT
jgi:hypothetical protein